MDKDICLMVFSMLKFQGLNRDDSWKAPRARSNIRNLFSLLNGNIFKNRSNILEIAWKALSNKN